MPKYSVSLRDRGREISTVSFNLGTFATEADRNTATDAIRTAVDGLSMGVLARATYSEPVKFSNAAPTAADAQRERKLLVTYSDDVTLDLYNVEIPILDTSVLTYVSANSDEVTLADGGAVQALVNAIEDNVVSKAGNAVSVFRAVHVGRNL